MTGNEHNTKRRRIIHIKSVSGYGKKGKREEEEKKLSSLDIIRETSDDNAGRNGIREIQPETRKCDPYVREAKD